MDIKNIAKTWKPKIYSIKMSEPWDKTTYYRELTSGELNTVQKWAQDSKGDVEIMAKTVLMAMVEKDGAQCSDSGTMNDLLSLPSSGLLKIGKAIMDATQKDLVADPKD